MVSSKGVLQDCHLSVSSQGVPQGVSLENVTNTYCLCYSTSVSAFGFLGILFFFWGGSCICSVSLGGCACPLPPELLPTHCLGSLAGVIF